MPLVQTLSEEQIVKRRAEIQEALRAFNAEADVEDPSLLSVPDGAASRASAAGTGALAAASGASAAGSLATGASVRMKRSRSADYDKKFYDSFISSRYSLFRDTTEEDPRAELRYVRRHSLLERQLSCIDDHTSDGVCELEHLFKQVDKHPLYQRFVQAFGLNKTEFGYSNNPKRELELWDMWHYEQTGLEWKV